MYVLKLFFLEFRSFLSKQITSKKLPFYKQYLDSFNPRYGFVQLQRKSLF